MAIMSWFFQLFLRRIILRHFAISSLMQLFIASASLLVMANVMAEETKIGYVSTERILRESEPAKAAEARLEGEFSQRKKELQEFTVKIKAAAEKLDKDLPVLTESERSNVSAHYLIWIRIFSVSNVYIVKMSASV